MTRTTCDEYHENFVENIVELMIFLNCCLILYDALDIGELIEKAQKIKATGGKPCGKTTSQGFKVRKNDGSLFVGAFCQSNVGDVTPNVQGAFCSDTGKPCDFNHSSCNGDNQLCLGRGPGYFHLIYIS